MRMMDENDPYEKGLLSLIVAISQQTKLDEQDQVLIALLLDSKEKIIQFKDWVKTRLDGDTISATGTEVMNAASKIGKGMNPTLSFP